MGTVARLVEPRNTLIQRQPRGARLTEGEQLVRATDPRTVGFITDSHALPAPGGFRIQQANGRNFEVIRQRFARTIAGFSMADGVRDELDTFVEWPREDIVPLPFAPSLRRAPPLLLPFRKAVREMALRSDLLIVRCPFPHPWLFEGIKKPLVLHVAGDAVVQASQADTYRGPTRLLAVGYAKALEYWVRRLGQRPGVRIVTNGSRLAAKLPGRAPTKAVVSSLMYRREMGEPRDHAPEGVPRLLFVGYFRPVKDLPTLLEAFERVRARRPVRLTLVGSQDTPSDSEREIHERIARSPYASDVECVGAIPFGPRLFDAYKAHDALLLTSFSEGTPRVLVEARAFGCPTIATDVGGVPDSIRDGEDGLLVPPKRPDLLAEKLERLLDDPELYVRLSRRGWERATREFPMEVFGDHLADALLDAASDFET